MNHLVDDRLVAANLADGTPENGPGMNMGTVFRFGLAVGDCVNARVHKLGELPRDPCGVEAAA